MKKYFVAASASLAGFAGAAQAAIPADVTTALADAVVDAGIIWLALLGIAIVGVGYKFGIFGAKKAPSMVK